MNIDKARRGKMTQFRDDEVVVEEIYRDVEPMALLKSYAAQCGVSLDEAVLATITCTPRVVSGRVCPEVVIRYDIPEGTSPRGVDPVTFADWFATVSEGVGVIGYIPVAATTKRPF